MNYDLVVIGGGPAGIAAAIEARKEGIEKILLIERNDELGGILNQCIHNGFGVQIFNEELTGPEYAERFINELESLNIEYLLNTMVINILEYKVIIAVNENGVIQIKGKAIILAMGCRERTRGAISIPGDRPSGILSAGTAQRYINIEGYMVGKKVVIVGSGDIGLIMARRLTLEGAFIEAVLEVQPYSSGLNRNIVQCLNDFNIPLKLNHIVTEIKGKERVTSVTVLNTMENKEFEIKCDTVLFSVGLIPENELSLKAGIKLDKITKGPIVKDNMETKISGIFACGNVLHVHDIVDYVTEESRRTGQFAADYIKKNIEEINNSIKIIPKKGISYVVPQYIRKNFKENEISLYFRVSNSYKNKKVLIKNGNQILKSISKKHLTPGEMEIIKIELNLFIGLDISNLSLEISEV